MNITVDSKDRVANLLIHLLLISAILVSYWQVQYSDFVGYDDQLYVTENRHVQAGITWEGVAWAFTTQHDASSFPLTWLSHMLDCELYGINPRGHHWTSLLIHMANTVLLFMIFKQMTGAIWQSVLVAALFGLHPMHVESVAWVAERKDVLCTFFGILSILAYCRYVKIPSLINYLLIILFLGLGLMAKPMLVTFPFVLLLLDVWPLNRFNNNEHNLQPGGNTRFHLERCLQLIWEKIPLFVLTTVFSVLTFFAERSGGAVKSLELFPLPVRVANAFVSYVKYIYKAIWPRNLAVFYPHPGDTLPAWQVVGAILLIAGAICFAWRSVRQYPYVAVGLFWYLGTLVPVIGMVQVGVQAMADRYTYIPFIGLFIVVVWGLSDISLKWPYRKSILAVFAVIVLLALAARTYIQVGYWKNAVTLFTNAINIDDNNSLAHNNLGAALHAQGNLEEAAFHLEKALRINPGDGIATNLAVIFAEQGNIDEAVRHLKETIKADPDYFIARYQLGLIFMKQNKLKESYIQLAEIIKVNPDFVRAYNQIGVILKRWGNHKGARDFFQKAVQLDPVYADARRNLERMNQIQGFNKQVSPN